METAALVQLLQILGPLIIQEGIPAVAKLIESFGVASIGPEHIQKLRELVKPPEEYFKK